MNALVWYWQGGRNVLNLGEHLVELLLPKIGINPISFDIINKDSHYDSCGLFIGSELHQNKIDDLLKRVDKIWVFGQGNGRGIDQRIKLDNKIQLITLRGALTKNQLEINYNVPLCDPGFLMPYYFQFSKKSNKEILYVPHHSNYSKSCRHLSQAGIQNATIVNPMIHKNDILTTLSKIVNAYFVLTNSLHCLILCLAYKVPCAVFLPKNANLNMPDKWLDVFSTLHASFVTVSTLKQAEIWWEQCGKRITTPVDLPVVYKLFQSLKGLL